MTNKRRRLNREQMQSAQLIVIRLLNLMKTKEEILEDLRKEEYLKHVTIYDVEYYIKKARNVSYEIRQSVFTPLMNLECIMNDIQLARKEQLEIMNGGDEIDSMTKLRAADAYVKSSILMGKVRNFVVDALEEEKNERKRYPKPSVPHEQPELRSENLQPSEIPEYM